MSEVFEKNEQVGRRMMTSNFANAEENRLLLTLPVVALGKQNSNPDFQSNLFISYSFDFGFLHFVCFFRIWYG